MKIFCICCNQRLRHACHDDSFQPELGLIATAGGNYGSTVFDPADAQGHLLFFICDACVKVKAKQQKVLYVAHGPEVDEHPVPIKDIRQL